MTWPPGASGWSGYVGCRQYDADISTSSPGDESEEPPTATQQRAEDQSPPRFHRRAPAEVAAQAGLGDDGAAQVERVQDFCRQIFELVEDEEWPNAPVGPRSAIPCIAIKANEFANTWDVLGPLIEERLWPNPRYSWLSGVHQHRTNRRCSAVRSCLLH